MQFGDKKVDFLCLDTELSQGNCENILAGRTYRIVPCARDVKVIVDIGANLGATSVFLSLHYPNARIFSLEPQAFPFEILTRNTSFYPNISVFKTGLFNSNRECPLYLSHVDSSTASIGRSWLNGQKTEMITLRDAAEWFQEHQITEIDILKIDTEGCEIPILSRLAPFIPKIQVIYVEYHSDADRRALDDLIGDTHVLYSAMADKPHVGELIYVRADLSTTTLDLHKHRIELPKL